MSHKARVIMFCMLQCFTFVKTTSPGCPEGFAFLQENFPSLLHKSNSIWKVLGCFEIYDKRLRSYFLLDEEPHGFYRHIMKEFLNELIASGNLGSAGSFFWRADDDSTLPVAVERALYHRGQPVVSHARKCGMDDYVVYVPDPRFIRSRGFKDILSNLATRPPWPSRNKIVYWRGSTTGESVSGCLGLPRVKMCQQAVNISWMDLKISKAVHKCQGKSQLLSGVMSNASLELAWTDFAGIMDIDGFVNAWGLYWRLASGSTVFRVHTGNFCNMYIKLLQPYVHYIPIKSDLSDLLNATAIITGHDAANFLQHVAANAQRLALSMSYEKQVSLFISSLESAWKSSLKQNHASYLDQGCALVSACLCCICLFFLRSRFRKAGARLVQRRE